MAAPVELLKHVPLFHGLSEKELKTLANNFTERTFTEGQELTHEGSGGVAFALAPSARSDRAGRAASASMRYVLVPTPRPPPGLPADRTDGACGNI